MAALRPGLHRIDADSYHADPAERPSLSSTLARLLIDRSPLHAWTASPRLNPDFQPVEKKTFDIGRAAHRSALGCGSEWCIIPAEILSDDGGIRSKEARAFVAEARAEGMTPIKEAEAEAVERMAAAISARLAHLRMTIDPAHSEVTALAEIDGVLVRAMIDNAPPCRPYLVDLKTTMNASPEACVRAVVEYGYDVQAAHYLDAWEAATGERRRMRFVFVEKEPPHEVSVVELHEGPPEEETDSGFTRLSSDWMSDAREKAAEARRLWRECLEADHWPGYPAKVLRIGAPIYHRQRWADRKQALAVTQPKPDAAALAAAARWQSPEGMQ